MYPKVFNGITVMLYINYSCIQSPVIVLKSIISYSVLTLPEKFISTDGLNVMWQPSLLVSCNSCEWNDTVANEVASVLFL